MGGSPSKTTTTQSPDLPPEVRNLINIGTGQTQEGLNAAPITEFQRPFLENIVGADPATLEALGFYRSMAGGTSGPEMLDFYRSVLGGSNAPAESMDFYRSVLGGSNAPAESMDFYRSILGGSATPGILEAFNKLQLPQIQQQMALAGHGNSAALGSAVAQGQAAAIMPALQLQMEAAGRMGSEAAQTRAQQMEAAGRMGSEAAQTRAQQMEAAGRMGQLGGQSAAAMAGIGDYLRQIEQQRASGPYQDFLRRQGITESLLSGATGLIPSSIGQRGTQDVKTGGLGGWLFGSTSGTPFGIGGK